MSYVVYGSLGFAAHVLQALPRDQVLAVVDHDHQRIGSCLAGITVAPLEQLYDFAQAEIVLATLDMAVAIDQLVALGIDLGRIVTQPLWQPFSLQLEPTARCNLSCSYCSRETLPESRKSMDLDFARFAHWIEPLHHLKRIHLQGLGEPLLNRDLPLMIEHCRKRAIDVSLTSNGMVSFTRLGHKAIYSLYKLVLSIDQANEQGAFLSRIGGSLGKLEDNLGWYLANRPADCRTRLAFNYVLCAGDESGIDVVVDIAKRYRPQELHFQLAENWFIPTQPEFSGGHALASSVAAWEQVYRDQITYYSAELFSLGISISFTGASPRLGRCHWPSAGLFVSVDGFVTPCCIRMDPCCFNLGQIGVDGDLAQIWFSQGYSKFRQGFMSVNGNGVCDYCPA
ncbi:SPASM domain-containing protein [Magnetovirga frankeli]|uniref:radical SAM protein n=1 Tax=Magnetovirga frankeli TaxID=947516 RepID=UPI001293F9E9|nr:SPASM domain-containing protein [gamma proteobacterium SS-5]